MSYLEKHQKKTFLLGLDPYSGMDYFSNYGVDYGYIHSVVELIQKETGLHIKIVGDKTWGQVVEDIKTGEIDILFGANATPERLEYLEFSKPITQYPYAAFAKKDSSIKTMADFDNKKIAFIQGDTSIPDFQKKFNKINPQILIYPGQIEALKALSQGSIDGFITSGGMVVNQFMYNFPDVDLIAEINTITSDMTLSTRKEDVLLRDMIDKIIDHYAHNKILAAIEKSKIDFNRKILHLTQKEISWLEKNEIVIAGMADNYLPFDYYEDGKYKGIGGAVLTKAADLVGIQLKVVHGDFSKVYDEAIHGKVDVINMSKSEDRLKYFIYTRPFF